MGLDKWHHAEENIVVSSGFYSDSFAPPQMTSGLEEKVSRELQEVGDFIRPMDMKDVKGLEERLYGLDQLMCTAGKLVDEQRHMAQVRACISTYK